ncbi:MAG: hypothetical protein ACPGVE_00740 [Flavobacteriales bacterium]
MDQKQATVYHYIFILYLAYAHLTDRKVSEEEGVEVQKKSAKWFKVNHNNIHIFNKIMMEATAWYNATKDDRGKYELLMNVTKTLAQIKEIDINARKDILSDLRDIAVADGRFGEEEKSLHDLIGKELGINILTADKNETNRKLGF